MLFVDETVTVSVDGDTRRARAAHNILPSHADKKGDGRRSRPGPSKPTATDEFGGAVGAANGRYPIIE